MEVVAEHAHAFVKEFMACDAEKSMQLSSISQQRLELLISDMFDSIMHCSMEEAA